MTMTVTAIRTTIKRAIRTAIRTLIRTQITLTAKQQQSLHFYNSNSKQEYANEDLHGTLSLQSVGFPLRPLIIAVSEYVALFGGRFVVSPALQFTTFTFYLVLFSSIYFYLVLFSCFLFWKFPLPLSNFLFFPLFSLILI